MLEYLAWKHLLYPRLLLVFGPMRLIWFHVEAQCEPNNIDNYARNLCHALELESLIRSDESGCLVSWGARQDHGRGIMHDSKKSRSCKNTLIHYKTLGFECSYYIYLAPLAILHKSLQCESCGVNLLAVLLSQ